MEEEIRKIFIIGEQYPAKEVKEKLKVLYEKYNLPTTSLSAADLGNWFNIRITSKRIVVILPCD